MAFYAYPIYYISTVSTFFGAELPYTNANGFGIARNSSDSNSYTYQLLNGGTVLSEIGTIYGLTNAKVRDIINIDTTTDSNREFLLKIINGTAYYTVRWSTIDDVTGVNLTFYSSNNEQQICTEIKHCRAQSRQSLSSYALELNKCGVSLYKSLLFPSNPLLTLSQP